MISYKVKKCFEFDEHIEEYFDCREGVLLDSYIGVTNYGALVCAIVTYVNPWASSYTVYESETPDDENEVWQVWQNFADAYDAEYPEEQ